MTGFKSKLRSITKWFFLIWGVITFVLVIVITGSTAWRLSNGFGTGQSDATVDEASEQDVRFILNWCKLGEARTEKVLHSSISPRSFTGDHTDAYAIKVRDLTAADLKKPDNDSEGGWVRCDQLDPVSREALRLVAGFTDYPETDWFPKEAELDSSRYYLWVWSIYIHGRRPTSAQLIFARPDDSMLFYASVKT